MSAALPLDVLAFEGPQARAYLVRMARSGLRARRIFLMVADPFTAKAGKPARVAPGPLQQWAERTQDRSHNHHPYEIRATRPELVRAIADGMTAVVDDPMAFYAEMYEGFSWERYADEVVRIPANGYKDPGLLTALSAAHPATVLFTGGGIVPKSVFEIPGIKLIHVHTGFLPHVRGADVLLWSLLVRGRPGVSAFFMTPGLDDGDVLAARELEPLAIPLDAASRADDDTLYRALFSFIDPLIRADLLVADVLEPAADVERLEATPQDLDEGITYHFMHPSVRSRALQVLYPVARASAETAQVKDESLPSPARYQRFYEQPSVLASVRFTFDTYRAKGSLRARSLQNRQHDYTALTSHPERRALHAELNRHLARQAEEWPSYDYGEGWFYQSSDELGITGLRDTTGRVKAFRLKRFVEGRSVLEIGCNTGFLSLAIAPAASRVVAFELNPHLIAMAEAGQRFLGIDNVEFSVAAFEDFPDDEQFDDVLSFANHHTYDGNTRQSLEEYFARCHAFTKPGGRLIFESHPPALEGSGFAHTTALIERYYEIERSEVHDYGTFLDKGRRYLIGTRRD